MIQAVGAGTPPCQPVQGSCPGQGAQNDQKVQEYLQEMIRNRLQLGAKGQGSCCGKGGGNGGSASMDPEDDPIVKMARALLAKLQGDSQGQQGPQGSPAGNAG